MIPLPEPFLNDVYNSWNCTENQNQNLHLEMETLEGRQWVGEEVVGKGTILKQTESQGPHPETRRWNTEWRLYSKNLGIWDVGIVDFWRRLEPSLSHSSEDGCSPEGERGSQWVLTMSGFSICPWVKRNSLCENMLWKNFSSRMEYNQKNKERLLSKWPHMFSFLLKTVYFAFTNLYTKY